MTPFRHAGSCVQPRQFQRFDTELADDCKLHDGGQERTTNTMAKVRLYWVADHFFFVYMYTS